MGFGEPARKLAELTPLEWRWGEGLGNYMAWLGGVEAGVRLRLMLPSYHPYQVRLRLVGETHVT
eukprot:scaffold4001_cov27-Phaeocystis_antarctica.AAC.2